VQINLAKLNHILIPPTKTGRDRFRQGWLGRALWPLVLVYESLSAEGRLLAVLSLIVGALGRDVCGTQVYVLWAALAGVLAGSLALRPWYALRGVRADVVVPKRVTIGEPITFALVLTNDTDRDYHAIRTSGPFLPWDGRWSAARPPSVAHLGAHGKVRVETSARFIERGEHHLDPFRVAALVPLGLAQGRPVATIGCRFLVVPKIARVVRLSLPMGRRHQPGGVALASKTGESMDLLGVRPYRVGDAMRDLHARSWARLGKPVVREYQEEYFSRVGVVVDIESASDRLVEAAISLAAGVVAHLGRGEALIDMLVVGGRVHDLTLGRSLGFLEQALDLLACVEAGKRSALGAPPHLDVDGLMARMAQHLPRLSCVVVVAVASNAEPLATRVRHAGVGCVTLHVANEAGSAPSSRDARVITAEAIERGEALSL
jgi:uncharacterized protein (DUF58 family)